MNRIICVLGAACLLAQWLCAEDSALTIYNQNFAVVRQKVSLALKSGINTVQFTDITAHLEPESVILCDPSGRRHLQILEQNYQPDPVSQDLLLSKYEGKTIDIVVPRGDKWEILKGKIIRSGYVPPSLGSRRYQQPFYQPPTVAQPILQVDGQLRFGLPGTPLFPALAEGTILKPTLDWVISTDREGEFEAELSYVTGGMNWQADYNVVAPPQGDMLEIVGWVTMENRSGRSFENARIKLMAGDVSKVQPADAFRGMAVAGAMGGLGPGQPPVTEKPFDEYHLYTLERRATLRDRETKQVESLRAAGVRSKRVYVYDGVRIDQARYMHSPPEYIRQSREYGTEFNTKVWVMQELLNAKANNLGMPLPKGRVRFYRRDETGQLEFTGENVIDHTPQDETIRVYTGSAFDLTGERRRMSFRMDTSQNWLEESFEIKLRNHKNEPVTVRVVEHLYRGAGWEITAKSADYRKTDSRTVEFPVSVPANGELSLTYTAYYRW